MIKIRFLSDLHLEFERHPYRPTRGDEDVVVLAGDIALGTNGIRWAKEVFAPTPVIYVLGNHEFYGHDFDQLIEQAREESRGSNVHLLENESLMIKGFRFLGFSLRTDFELLGKSRFRGEVRAAERQLNDYREIRRAALKGSRRITAADTRTRHLESRRWLTGETSSGSEPAVVVTHHAPLEEASSEWYRGVELSGSFCSDLNALLKPPVVAWLSGHTHFQMDLLRSGVRMLSNQRGYPHKGIRGFDWDRTVTLDMKTPPWVR